MPGICRIIVAGFVFAWLAAVVLLLVGTFGWFGQEKDPLSGVFLVPLGLPWNQFLEGIRESLKPWAAALAPGVNMVILRLICAFLPRRD